MWSRTTQQQTNEPDGNDVVGRFGFGTYKITDTELIENIEYGDAGMMAALDTMRTFTFELVLKDDTYSQISTDEDGNRTFSENYLRIDQLNNTNKKAATQVTAFFMKNLLSLLNRDFS